MKIIIKLGKKILQIVYFFHKKTDNKKKITFISRQSNSVSLDFQLLIDELNKNTDFEIEVLCKKIGDGFFDKVKYLFHMMGPQMKALANSEFVILDGYCILVSLLKHKESLKVIQMWHAMGALKKFGYSIIDKEEGSSSFIAEQLKMHKGYDYIFVSSDNCKPLLREAYNCEEEQFEVYPLPRIDKIKSNKFLQEDKERILSSYPKLKNKKNILFAPTFRKDGNQKGSIQDLVNSIDYNEYNLIFKPHPLFKEQINNTNIINIKEYSSLELLSIADYVITDYSAFVFEACLSNKPIFLYLPDYKDYIGKRGFYIDLIEEDFCYYSENPKEVIKAINQNEYSLEKINHFVNKYISYSESYTKDIVDFILLKRR